MRSPTHQLKTCCIMSFVSLDDLCQVRENIVDSKCTVYQKASATSWGHGV